METNQPTNMAEGQIASEIQQETGDDDSSSPTTTVSGDGTPADQTTEDQSGNGDDDSRETPKEKEESGGEGSEDSKANDGNNNPDSKVVTEIPAEETSGSKGPENSAAAAAAAAADESSQTTSTTTQPNHDSIANSKGAQILMTRFSTWSKAANEKTQTLIKQAPAFQENAKTLWERAPNISANIPNISANMPAMPRLQAAMRSAKEVMPAGEKIDGESDPVTSTTTTTTTTAPVKSKGLPGMGLFVKQSSVTDSSVGDEEDEISSSSEDSSDFSVKTEEGKTAEDTDGANSSGEQGERPARRGAALAGLSKAFTAHSGVAESVATGFRGRYNSTAATAATPPPKEQEPGSKPSPESQTSLILKSRVGKHMQDILDKLESHEYAMLLGNGMLGVNLKQCYLKNHGVFIDFLVEGGQAQASSVVRAGDLLIKLGDVDLRKGIIMEVPQQIARERRPIVLILASGTKVPIERMNYIDITVAMMHRAREFYNKRGSFSSLPGASPQKEQTDDAENSQKEEKNVEPIDLFGTSDIKSICEAEVPVDESADNFVTPPAPTMALRKEFFDEIAVR